MRGKPSTSKCLSVARVKNTRIPNELNFWGRSIEADDFPQVEIMGTETRDLGRIGNSY